MKRTLHAIPALLLVCAMTLACAACSCLPFGAPASDGPAVFTDAPAAVPDDGPTDGSAFRPERIEAPTDLPFVPLYAQWTDLPVYGCMTSDGALRLYVYAYQDSTAQYGMLNASIDPSGEDPAVVVDYESGFADTPDFAMFEEREHTDYMNVVSAAIEGVDTVPRMYYTILDTFGDPITVIPVEVFTVEYGYEVDVEVAEGVSMCVYQYVEDQTEEGENPQAEEPTQEPVAGETDEPVDMTPAPGATEATDAPNETKNPTTQKPTNTPEPTEAPETYTCQYCGKSFGTNFSDFYYHAYIDPGCYNYGYAVTPSPSPTPTPSHPAGNGYWKEVWVVDEPAVYHTIWHCNTCGYESTVWYGDFKEHMGAHADANENTSYYDRCVKDKDEVGHWETVWVPDP